MTALLPFSTRLLDWFDRHGRHDLPWQHPRTPYRVWVSEIMLQQTQVQTVIGYFERFMAAFPTLGALASASEDEVLALWAGLGYYARGRNLHRAARELVAAGQHELPGTLEGLMALPGVGRSTAGAILSMGFGRRGVILDGNVKRVLCRHRAIRSWAGERQTEQQLWQLAEALTPTERACDYTQAIMDLGATVCRRRNPLCEACPVREDCLAHAQNLTDSLPVPKPRKTVPERSVVALILHDEQGRVLVERRPGSGIWGGLWCPPLSGWDVPAEQARAQLASRFGLAADALTGLPGFQHTFTHFRLHVVPVGRRVGVEWMDQMLTRQDQDAPLSAVQARTETHGLPAPFRRWLTHSLSGEQA